MSDQVEAMIVQGLKMAKREHDIGVKTLRKHIKIESSNYTMFLPHFY